MNKFLSRLDRFSTRRLSFGVALLYCAALLIFTPFSLVSPLEWGIMFLLMWGNFAFVVWFVRYKPKRERLQEGGDR